MVGDVDDTVISSSVPLMQSINTFGRQTPGFAIMDRRAIGNNRHIAGLLFVAQS